MAGRAWRIEVSANRTTTVAMAPMAPGMPMPRSERCMSAPILDMRRGGAAKMRAIAEEASALVRKYKGAYSGEHGDGLCRGEWVAWQFGPKLNDAFRAIKRELDPAGLFQSRQDHRSAENG